MSRPQSTTETLDLFGFAERSLGKGEPARFVVEPVSAPPRRGAPVDAALLTRLSDADLARLTADVAQELRRRVTQQPATNGRPELLTVVQRAAAVLASLSPRNSHRSRMDGTGEGSHPKDKAIRSALKAGVKPGQIAKHFGVPLAIVRRIAAERAG
jgi:hypothetical protein